MKIKKLIGSVEEHVTFAWSIISWKLIENQQIWTDEDLTLIQPFTEYKARNAYIKMAERIPMTTEEKLAEEHYNICKKLYVDYLENLKNYVEEYEVFQLCEFLFINEINYDGSIYDYNDDGQEIDENGNVVPPKTIDAVIPYPTMEYPFIFTAEIGYNHSTDNLVLFSDNIVLKDFLVDELRIT